jgi:hypothetical protein
MYLLVIVPFLGGEMDSRNDLVGRRAWHPVLQMETRHRDFRRRWTLRATKVVPKCVAYANISRAITRSMHGDPAFGAMGNLEEQELPLQLCIGFVATAL